MKYFVVEGDTSNGKFNATSKAREDAETILIKMNFKQFEIRTLNRIRESKLLKIFQYIGYYKNFLIWKSAIKKLKENDIVVIQYPLINTIFFLKKILILLNKKKVKSIALIHDLDSIRLSEAGGFRKKRSDYEDHEVLKLFTNVISHNEKMTEILAKFNVKRKNVVELSLFDYITDDEIDIKNRGCKKPVIIAGNLSSFKARFLKDLYKLKGVNFNLYGKGLDIEISNNIKYKGSYLPSELCKNLCGSFGLVWDGNSIDGLDGPFGTYMKYNNPHKLSLYLASKLPVIVSKESALSKLVIENNIGIAIESLKDLEKEIKKIDESKYAAMMKNVNKISKKIRNGMYLEKAINTVIK